MTILLWMLLQLQRYLPLIANGFSPSCRKSSLSVFVNLTLNMRLHCDMERDPRQLPYLYSWTCVEKCRRQWGILLTYTIHEQYCIDFLHPFPISPWIFTWLVRFWLLLLPILHRYRGYVSHAFHISNAIFCQNSIILPRFECTMHHYWILSVFLEWEPTAMYYMSHFVPHQNKFMFEFLRQASIAI